ncbi:hypothetical protein Pan161_33040 [Gimesia algae]|uniref:Uncharacterized protein n=1 Tax=Gimesia algae TaxID=2527971 RepID=A0A517VF59_9PLAN|nr:hypothetical protein Pan161_33040 [Gimesia algae]
MKTFGLDVPNWSTQKSLRTFWSNPPLIDPKLKHRLYFQWKLGIMLIVLGFVSFLISEFSQ